MSLLFRRVAVSSLRGQRTMAGHSHWHNIRHKKGSNDEKKSAMFHKIAREIQAAINAGAGDRSESNVRLQAVLSKAKAMSTPKDILEKALKKQESKAAELSAVTYEAMTAERVSLIIEALTDSKNRTASSVRATLNRRGGKLLRQGELSRVFRRTGLVVLKFDGEAMASLDEDELMERIMGVDDIEDYVVHRDQDNVEVLCSPDKLNSVRLALAAADFDVDLFGLTFIASDDPVELDNEARDEQSKGTEQEHFMRLYDELEENPDVQNVYHNAANMD
jgi:YebC/PmpR family DNA-binding regulatory protein